MNYPYLLFDADDTLFDFPKASSFAFSALCKAQQIPDVPQSRQLFRTISQELWAAFDRQEITKDQLLLERFSRFLQALTLNREPRSCSQCYLEALGAAVYPLPQAEVVCRTLARRGHQLFILTNGVASVQRNHLRCCSFGQLFSGIFISEEAGAAKPDPAYYQYVFDHVPGLTRKNALVIGDSLSSDIQGANAAGLPCCWFNPNGKTAAPGLQIDYEIRKLNELLTIIS